jgi:predicted acylesterase/phospholipase RssA
MNTRRIGLALSGGGFRASLFHLGVIRRLEELGIMKDVAVVSSVSGGSIIAAYYLVEMERRLRKKTTMERETPEARVEVFEEIAKDFIEALDHNLRTRALIFTPFYHPWLFLKTLFFATFRAGARAELIQAEYDKWFFDEDTLDQLPSVTPSNVVASSLMGPKLVINTTSLLTGEGVSFSREPNTDLVDLRTPDRNFIRLSKVVGASAGVPVIFPPTPIRGDLLVDGGVADNQGIAGLTENKCEVFIVSDASGQMEAVDTMKTSEAAVYLRVSSIFQFQIREKLLDSLGSRPAGSVAFVHLYLNLKDREAKEGRSIPRLTSEVIPALARIRTDLDQFSPVERESLMYHGYTLIDASLKANCPAVMSNAVPAPMRVAPLFAGMMTPEARGAIRADLEAGRQGIFLLRTLDKYPSMVAATYITGLLSWLIGAVVLLWEGTSMAYLTRWISTSIVTVIPDAVEVPLGDLLRYLNLEISAIIAGISSLTSFLVVCAVPLYLALFWVFSATRRIARSNDLALYKKIVGTEPTLHWKIEEEAKPREESPLKARAATP